jgi:hypothetical protein
VIIHRCTVNAGDDAICLKSSGHLAAGAEPALQNVIVAECTVYRGHGGFVLGGYTEDGMRNVWATQCTFIGTDVGIRIKSGVGHGGPVRDVTVDQIAMKGIVHEAILFDTGYSNLPTSDANLTSVWWSSRGVPVARDELVPEFGNFQFSRILCRGAGQAVSITGLNGHPVHDVFVRDSVFSSTRGITVHRASNVQFDRVTVVATESPPLTVTESSNVRASN